MTALGQADVIVSLTRRFATSLREGSLMIADARVLESTIREAEGWLVAARRFLDPADPIGGRTDAV